MKKLKNIIVLFACLATTGRKLACKDAFAGVRKIFITTDSLGTITFNVTQTDVVIGFATGVSEVAPEFFQSDLDSDAVSNLTETPATSRDNGTTVVSQALTAVLAKLDKDTHTELTRLMQANPTIVVEHYDGAQVVMGLETQVNIGEIVVTTGAARADLTGYTQKEWCDAWP